ncbi:hypothetical protein Bca101_040266 [Brassica carinata]
MASETSQQLHPPLHFVLFPFMAQGHMIPMVDIARLLAQRGVTITIVTTPQNEARFKNILSRTIQSGLPIRLEHVKIPFQEVGLLEEHENVDSLDSMELIVPFFKAVNMVEEPVMKLMEEMKPKPTCLISDFCLPYTSKIAKKENIGVLVDKERVKKAVENLMGESEESKVRRRRVKELGELAHKAVEEGGSSHSNITCFLEDMMQLAQSKK